MESKVIEVGGDTPEDPGGGPGWEGSGKCLGFHLLDRSPGAWGRVR